MKRTGRKRYRAGWFGKVILQFEWVYCEGAHDCHVWRDATVAEITELLS